MSNWDLWTYSVTVVPFCYHDSLIPWIVPTDIYSLFSHLLCDDWYHVLLLLIVFPLKGNPAFENLHLWFCWGPLLHLVNKEWRPKNHGPMFSRIQTLSYKWVINSLQWQSNRSTGEILELQLAPSSIFPQCPSNKPLLIADCARYWTLWYLVFWVFKLSLQSIKFCYVPPEIWSAVPLERMIPAFFFSPMTLREKDWKSLHVVAPIVS
jgi:hypothetical protein